MDHVYARVTGFGIGIIPLAPFSIRLIAPRQILATHFSDEGPRQVSIELGDGAPQLTLSDATSNISQVADIVDAKSDEKWVIETSVYRVPLLEGLELVSPEEDASSNFDLLGPNGQLLWIQGPFELPAAPTAEQICAPDQTVAGTGTAGLYQWYDFSYAHGDENWRQRYYCRRFDNGMVLMVTVQSPEESFVEAAAAADSIANGLEYPL